MTITRSCASCSTQIKCHECATRAGCWHRLCAPCGAGQPAPWAVLSRRRRNSQ